MSSPALLAARYARTRWDTPLSDSHAGLLPRRLDLPTASHLLDPGCGWGELLLRAVDAAPTGQQEWLLANPADPQATEVGDELDSRLRRYVDGYRSTLGLGYLVLGRPRSASRPGGADGC